MNDLLQKLLEQLKASSLAAKATAVLVAIALCAVGVVAGVVSSRPHFELLYSGLSAPEAAAIQRALAEGEVRYEVSQPPGPFSIFVEQGARYGAQNLVAASGALERAPAGIPGGESGLSTVFMSSGEREQMVRKREWEETEGMLLELDFVAKARVRTSTPKRSPFGRKEPVTASVALTLAGGRPLDEEQAESVANLVRFGLGVERPNLVITDQHGRPIFDGSQEEDRPEIDDWVAFQETHDRNLERRVNDVLAGSFGDGRARVTVRSEWDFDHVQTRSEETQNTKAVVSDVERSSKTPVGSAARPAGGGPAGTASNVGSFGTDQAGVVGTDSSSEEDAFAETEDRRTEYVPSWRSTETQRTTPVLRRLSVSLLVDEELDAKRTALEDVVRAAVGFDESRGDQIRSMPVALPEEAPAEAEGVGTEPGDAPVPASGPAVEEPGRGPLVEKLVEVGVEIVAALAFVLLLFKSVRGARSGGGGAEEDAGPQPDAVDPEALARARVDELLVSDPERVGEILSTWAREEAGSRS